MQTQPTSSSKEKNQGLLRLMLLLVVLAGFLVMYSVTRPDPNMESSSSSNDQNKNSERAKQRKLFMNEKGNNKNGKKKGKGKLIDEIYQSKKKKFHSSGTGKDNGNDDDDDDNDGDAGAVIKIAPRTKNRKGDDVPAGQGRLFDEKHIDKIRQMVMIGRQKGFPSDGIHHYHNVHEDDLEDHIRRDKDNENGGLGK